MADATKYAPINGGTLITDFRSHFSLFRTKRNISFAYGFIFVFIAFTIFLAFSPSSNSSSPWFTNIFTTNFSSNSSSNDSSHFSSIVTYFFPNSSSQIHNSSTTIVRSSNNTELNDKVATFKPTPEVLNINKTVNMRSPLPDPSLEPNKRSSFLKNQGTVGVLKSPVTTNQTVNSSPVEQNFPYYGENNDIAEKGVIKNPKNGTNSNASGFEDLVKSLVNCNLYDGNWVKDESYPLYKPGSCSLIDEQFNCFLNGRPGTDYYKLKWKPKGCTLPRLNGTHMLELLRGKRLVFVGDSLNRNMWESLVCILRNSVKDQKKVYEESGRHHFRSEPSYTFIFEEYNSRVEFFVSPFLVQPWEVSEKDGKKETLRLDLIGSSADKYKTADILIFNTGHWWTHDKTSKGKDYYQEGSHVYNELNVLEAFRKAITTWGRWVDANVNPFKTHVMFRGYSASHFSGGQWNSGGACDQETEPIKNEIYLTQYPSKMLVLEKVFKGMKSHISYLNITRMTDYRKDGHPSIYRKLNYSEEERKSPLIFQDCSHWCLPCVPDAWNELLYAEMLLKQIKKHQK